MPVIVRPAEARDAAQLVEMAAALTAFEADLVGDVSRRSALTEAHLARYCFCAAPLIHALIAESGGQAVGYILFHRAFDSETATAGLWMDDLYVEPQARRAGAGRALLAALARAARDHDAAWIAWQVMQQNSAAQAFYDRYGTRDSDPVYWTYLTTLEERLA
ncbi:MAG: GNAT family N-acetyltransferase [Kiloniellales bacterium]